MDKKQIKEILNTLIMVTGDCPHERGVGNGECLGTNCVDCWKETLSKELKSLEEEK